MPSKTGPANVIYVAVESFITRDLYIAEGTRLRGDRIVGPERYWVEAGDDADVAAAQLKLGDDVLEAEGEP